MLSVLFYRNRITGGFLYAFSGQNRRFMVSEEGYESIVKIKK